MKKAVNLHLKSKDNNKTCHDMKRSLSLIVIVAALLFCGTVSAQQHYQFNVYDFHSNMPVIAQIQIDGVAQTSTDIELGASNGDEVRGSHLIGDDALVWIQVYANSASDDFTFKIYNHQTLEEMDNCSVTLEFDEIGYGTQANPVVLNFVSPSTYTREIAGYGEATNPGGYYLIASPVGEVNPTDIEGMTDGAYDLYAFDQSYTDMEWRNHKVTAFNMVSGKGYLYAHNTTLTHTFTGMPYNGEVEFDLDYDETANEYTRGWNLMGNPFAQTAYIDRPFYTTNADGEIIAGQGNAIGPMEGIFVIATEAGETLTFSTEAPVSKGMNLVVNLSRSFQQTQGSATSTIDRVIVRFDEVVTLPKLMLNGNNTKLYIPQDGMDYSVVFSEGKGELPISFKAEAEGTYSLDFTTENVAFGYLHLIDNLTGADIDLLHPNVVIAGKDPQSPTPMYTFTAKTTDPANRFKLMFAIGHADDM